MRIKELDGLRGIASLVVLMHHSLLTIPALAGAYFGLEVTGLIPKILVYTPLHLFWAGTEAVFLFFVLSGIVLSRMTLSVNFNLSKYYPSRVLRILGPTVIAVLIGAILVFSTSAFGNQPSPWLNGRNVPYPLSALVSDLTLIGGTSGRISQLWSLQWELIFSLALPLFLYLKTTRIWTSLLIQLAVISLGAFSNSAVLTFLPMFGIGVVLGMGWNDVIGKSSRFFSNSAFSHFRGAFLLFVSLILISSNWIILPLSPVKEVKPLSIPLSILGIVLLVILTVSWKPLTWVFTTRTMTWLGAISFSLYLVHEPIVVAIAFISNSSKLGLLIGLIVSLIAAQLFYRFIEKPIHKRARKLLEV